MYGSTVQQRGCIGCHNYGNLGNLGNPCIPNHSCPGYPNHHIQYTQDLDPNTVVNHFLIEYYRSTSNIGWNAAMYLFDPNCSVICRDKHVGNAHNFLNTLSTEYIKRANYNSLRSKWMKLNNNSILINVFGHIQFVGFNGHVTGSAPFTETFVLTTTNIGNVSCTHHMIDF